MNNSKYEKYDLKRGLKTRHLNMIALGGAIGTGLFLASGSTIADAGPAGSLVAYSLIGVIVYFLMTSLAEISAFLPTSGSFTEYAGRFVDKSFGFAAGWNYWYNWAITLAFELGASAKIMQYWFPNVPSVLFSSIFLVVILGINIFSVRGFGEAEFWFSSVKVGIVIIFLIVGAGLIFGVGSGEPIGFGNWSIDGAPFHNGLFGVIGIFIIAGFSFQGTELIGVAAGETENPEKSIPKAAKAIFWRLLLFYVITIAIIGTIIPWTNENLTVENVLVSPFTLVFEKVGIPHAADVMNFVILTAVLSAGNSGTYASTRTLYSLAKQNQAPKLFARLTRGGVPIFALLATLLVGSLTLLSGFFGEGVVYDWLINLSALSGFISWFIIAVAHYRFRKGYVAQGKDLSKLPFRAKFFPIGQLLTIGAICFVILGQNISAITGNEIDWQGLIAAYVGIPVFLAVYLIHKFKFGNKIVKYQEIDFGK